MSDIDISLAPQATPDEIEFMQKTDQVQDAAWVATVAFAVGELALGGMALFTDTNIEALPAFGVILAGSLAIGAGKYIFPTLRPTPDSDT